MITTRDLNLREKEVKKNLYEMSSTLKAQPVGGRGALIQKPAQNPPREKRTPTIFTPSPMVSSLPYLSDAAKYSSNEVTIMTKAHLMQQIEAAKKSIKFDDMKQQELIARTDRVLDTISKNFSMPTNDLLRNYLSGEINKVKNEERKVLENRMRRVDLELNPIRPTETARPEIRLPTLTRGDMGRPNQPTQADLREVRTTYYQREPEEDVQLNEMADKFRQSRAVKKLQDFTKEAKLDEMADKFRQLKAVKKLQEFALAGRPLKQELEAKIRASNFKTKQMSKHLLKYANLSLEGYKGIQYDKATQPTNVSKKYVEKALARYEAKPTAKGFKSFINRAEEPDQVFQAGRTGGGGGGGGGEPPLAAALRQLHKGI